MPELYSPLSYFLIGLLFFSGTIFIWKKRQRVKKGVETSNLHPTETPSEVNEGEQQDEFDGEMAHVNEVIERRSRKIPLASEIVEHYCIFLKTTPTILDDVGDIAIAVFPPKGKRGWWTYATAGLSHVTGIELTLCSYNESDEIVGHLSYLTGQIIDHYDRKDSRVSTGSVIALPSPIVQNSHLSHVLFIPPYFEEDGFEYYIGRGKLVHVLALVPITEQESHLCLTEGRSALESKFEEHECNTLDFFRESTV